MRNHFWPYVGVGVAAAFAGFWGFGPFSLLGQALLVVSGISMLGAVVIRIHMWRSRYDLGGLQRFHELEEVRNIELDEPEEYDSVQCLNCGAVYNIRMPVCPDCGWTPGHPVCRN